MFSFFLICFIAFVVWMVIDLIRWPEVWEDDDMSERVTNQQQH